MTTDEIDQFERFTIAAKSRCAICGKPPSFLLTDRATMEKVINAKEQARPTVPPGEFGKMVPFEIGGVPLLWDIECGIGTLARLHGENHPFTTAIGGAS